MKVFVTGASGYLGTALVAELIAAGHRVIGLVRAADGGRPIAERGASFLVGELQDTRILTEGARDADAVVHLAWASGPGLDSVAVDAAAIAALGSGLEGTGGRLVVASGVLGLDPGRRVTEATRASARTSPVLAGRAANGESALAFTDRGVAPVLVRLAPAVHDDGRIKPGFAGRLVEIARRAGSAGYPGDGAMRWSAVHRLDAARLFRLAVEGAEAGAVLDGVAEEGVTQRALADTIAAGLGVPARSLADEELPERFGWLAPLVALDGPASSAETRSALGWTPTHPGLLDDLRAGVYFDGAAR